MRETNAALRASVLPAIDAGARAGARRVRRRDAPTVTRRRSAAAARDYSGALVGAGDRRARDSDLDRRGRHAHRRPARRRGAAARAARCRSPRRPSSPTSAPRCCTRAPSCRPSSATSRCASSTRAGPTATGTLITAEPVRSTAPPLTGARVQARRDGHRHHLEPDADGLRLPAPRVRGVRALPHGGRRGDDVGGQRLGDGGRSPPPRRRSPTALTEFGEVSVEAEMALLCAVGDRLRNEPEIARARGRRARGGAAADDFAGRGAAEHHRRAAPGRPAARDAAAARGVLRMKVLIVGYGKMGQHGRAAGRASRASRLPAASTMDATSGRRPTWPSTSRPPMRCVGNFPQLPASSGCRSSSGRPAGRRTNRACVLKPSAPASAWWPSANFSIGVNIFQLVVAEAARLMQAQPQYGAWVHEQHHAAKRDAPSGTALLLRDAMMDAGFGAADRHVVDAGRHDSGHPHGRIRRRRRIRSS